MYDGATRIDEERNMALEQILNMHRDANAHLHAKGQVLLTHQFRRPIGISRHLDQCPLVHIVRSRWQPRQEFDEEALGELVESISQVGIRTPLRVFVNEWGQFELIAGERRWRAAHKLELLTVPVEVVEGTAAELAIDANVDNLQRANLRPIEEGAAFETLIGMLGCSEAELARRLGKNRAYIQQRRALAQAAPEVQQALAGREINLTQARALATGDHKVQRAALKVIRRIAPNLPSGVPEGRIKDICNMEALKLHKKKLLALGWSVEVRNMLIWSADERPSQWSASRIVETVQEARRCPAPAGDQQADFTLAEDDEGRMFIHMGYLSGEMHKCPPWLYYQGQFYGPMELRAVFDGYVQQEQVMYERFARHGWEMNLVIDRRLGRYEFVRRGPDGQAVSVRRASYWTHVEDLITRLDDGEDIGAAAPGPPVVEHCAACKAEAAQTQYLHGAGRVCAACYDRITREIRERQEQEREDLRQSYGNLVVRMDHWMLELLLGQMRSNMWLARLGSQEVYVGREERAHILAHADLGDLREALLDCLLEQVLEHRAMEARHD